MEEAPEVRKQARSPTRPGVRQRARLEREANSNILDTHWVDIKGMKLNQPTSDFHYKHHVSRLMTTYTRPTCHVDNLLQPVSRVVKPITQLYGVHGLLSNTSDDVLKKREDEWRGRVDIYEKLDHLSQQKYRLHEHSYQNSASAAGGAAGPEHFSSCAAPPLPASSYEEHTQHSHSRGRRRGGAQTRKPSRRADFDGISENDLVANGLYALSAQQLAVFRDFTDMISSFDNTDMVHLLEDALEEAKSKAGLEDYGGFA